MLGRVQYSTVQSQLDTGGRYEDLPDPTQGIGVATLAYRKLQGLEADPLVLEMIRHAFFREACVRVYGRHASVSIFRAMLMNKPAGQGTHMALAPGRRRRLGARSRSDPDVAGSRSTRDARQRLCPGHPGHAPARPPQQERQHDQRRARRRILSRGCHRAPGD